MPALEPFSAARAVTDFDIKLSHDLLANDLLLILGLGLVLNGSAATRTTLRQGCHKLLIHGLGYPTAVVFAVCGTGFPAIGLRVRLLFAPGKRGSLPLQTPASFFQFLQEALVFALQPLVLLAQSLHFLQSPVQIELRNIFQGDWIGGPSGFRPPVLVCPSHLVEFWHGSVGMSSLFLWCLLYADMSSPRFTGPPGR